MPPIRSVLPVLAALLALACSHPVRSPVPSAPVEVESTEMPVPAPSDFPDKVQNESSAYWIGKWRGFKRDAASSDSVDAVFIGDSMTERFPSDLQPDGLDVANRGIGGDKVGGWKYYGLVDRLDVSVCALQPRVVTLMIGVNDIVYAGTPRDSMAANCDRLLAEMRACVPDARIAVLSVLPVRTTNKAFNAQIVDFNATVRALAARHGCEFVDLHPLFLDGAGELRAELASDTVHLNADGYRIWASAIEHLFER